MGKTLQKFSVEQKGWVKGILLVWSLIFSTFLTGFQAQAQATATLTTTNRTIWQGLPDASKPGWTENGLGTDFNQDYGGGDGANPAKSANFNSAGDMVTVHFDAEPGPLTYNVARRGGTDFDGGLFVVEQSSDGGSYDVLPKQSITSLTTLSNAPAGTFNPDPTARYIRFRYVTRPNTANVALDNVTLLANSGPEIAVLRGTTTFSSGGIYTFTQQNVNTTSGAVAFTIDNLGGDALTLSGTPAVALSGADASQFTVVSQPATPIAGGGSTSFSVNFKPTSAGVKNATLTIANNDPDEGSYVVNLAGDGVILAPTLSASNPFDPDFGPVGTSVTLFGTNLINTSHVRFNGVDATFTPPTADGQVTAVVPAGATSGPVTVYTDNGTKSATSSSNFTVGPTVSSFTPAQAFVGQTITITGLNFENVSALRFGGTDATNGTLATITASTSTSITADVPVGAQTGRLWVTTPAGAASSTSDFLVLYPPVISSFSPASGPVGRQVTVNGSNFISGFNLYFKDTNGSDLVATSPQLVNSGQVTALVPAGAVTGQIKIVTAGGKDSTTTDFIVIPAPVITSLDQTEGFVGDALTISGNFLDSASVVRFGGTDATNGTLASILTNTGNTITTTVPAGAQSGLVWVTTPGGSASSPATFTVLYQPVISGFTPDRAKIGQTVTISGTHLENATALRFGGTDATNGTLATILSNTATEITAAVPAAAQSGRLWVTTAGGSDDSDTDLTVLYPPVISSFTPTSGPVGTQVTVDGSEFVTGFSLFFKDINGNDLAATSPQLVSPTRVTASVPTGAATGIIKIVTEGGEDSTATNFTVIPAPVITSLDQTEGFVGEVITINGNFLDSASTIRFGGTDASNGTLASILTNTGSVITAAVPAGAQSGLVWVTTPGGSASSPEEFTVKYKPVISSFSPASGPTGTLLTVDGDHFTEGFGLALKDNDDNLVYGDNPVFVSKNRIRVNVPAGAVTSLLYVFDLGGADTSTTAFTVIPAPIVSGFTPAQGFVGQAVTINGSFLDSASVVRFGGTDATNGTLATILTNTGNTITTTVPAGAQTGPIWVTTPGGSDDSPTDFIVQYRPDILTISPTQGKTGTAVTIGGNFLDNALSVRFGGTDASSGTAATILTNTGNTITTTVPAGAQTGRIWVTTPNGSDSSDAVFTMLKAPVISSFSPASGKIGTTVTVEGANFIEAFTLLFRDIDGNDLAGTSPVWVDSTRVRANVPAGAVTGRIRILTEAGLDSTGTVFTVIPAPVIAFFDPTSEFEGQTVTIEGSNLDNVLEVRFGGTDATNGVLATITANTSSSVTVTVPTGAQDGLIWVTTPGGSASSADPFTVLHKPVISSFSPTEGPYGTQVTVFGAHFTEGFGLAFKDGDDNLIYGDNPIFTNSSIIKVNVPVGAITSLLYVFDAGGADTSAAVFTVIPVPAITSFSPASGPIGTVVTIEGENFLASTEVFFNGVKASVTSLINDSTMTATVPTGATDGLIKVSNTGVEATSATPFTVTATGTYVWNVASGSWADPNSWNPVRNTPGAGDELIFDGNITPAVTATLDFGSESVGQLKFRNNVNATFTMAGDQTLTIDGGVSGTDLDLPAGSSLNITNTAAGAELQVTLTDRENGIVGGALTMQGAGTAAHHIIAVDAASLVFLGGSSFTTDTNFTGNPFGNVHAGAVYFADGSVFNNRAGGSPFGAASPNGVVSFAPASTYRHEQDSQPDLIDRQYGNFVIDFPDFSQSVAGSGDLNVVNLTMASGTAFNLNLVGQISINGNIDVTNAGSALAFNPAAASAFNIVGSGTKTLTGAGSFTVGGNASLNVNTGNTLVLNQNMIEGTGSVRILGSVSTTKTGGLITLPASNPAISSDIILSTDPGSIVIYNGSGDQQVSPYTYANLVIADRAAGTVTLPAGTLQISEVFTPASGLTYATAGSIVEFIGAGAQTIPVFPYDGLKISGGAKSLAGNIRVSGIMEMAGGQVLTDANRIILETTAEILNESETSYIDGWVEAVARPVAQNATETFGNIGLSLNPANAGGLSSIGVVRQSGDAAGVPASEDSPVDQPSIKRVFDITGPESGVDVTMTFAYLNRELNGNAAGSLHLFKQQANQLWEEQTANAYIYGAKSVTYPGVTGFSKWTLATPTTVLPVELTAFTAKRVNDAVELKWTTAMEQDNQGFDVEVSTDALYYQKVGSVASKNPNSRAITTYSFTDDKTLSAGTRYYRLKQVDLDGKVTYYGPRTVFVESMATAVKVFPNPFNDMFKVKYVAETSHTLTLTVLDAAGKKIQEQHVSLVAGTHYLPVEVGNHRPKGVYLLQLSGAQGTQTIRVLKK
ncbi:MAG: IPT/TIG domain-containing protein [Adhaeribacter sp.]